MSRAVTVAVVAGLVTAAGAAPVAAGDRAFVGARLIDGTGRAPVESATLVVRDGRVLAVGPSARVKPPAGAETVDLKGKTLLPGLINAHGHVGETRGLVAGPEHYTEDNLRRQLGLYARYGVTTVVSLGGDREAGFRLRREQDRARRDRARLYVAGPVVAGQTAEEARRQVDAVAALEPDLVKIRVDDNLGTAPKMPAAAYQAAIEQAHRHGLRVAAHVFYLEDARGLLNAGVDFLAHSVRDTDVDDGLVASMKQKGVCLCPTLMREVSTFAYETAPDFFSDPFFLRDADREAVEALEDPARQRSVRESSAAQRYKAALEVAKRNLKRLAGAGVGIAFGTDTGPPGRFQGYFEHRELELMVQSGLTPLQALTAATGGAARCLKLDGIGTLEPGAWADFLVLGADPLADIRNTRSLESVWLAGERLPR
jgi:imidazolonepropionase-like amidohydrolase